MSACADPHGVPAPPWPRDAEGPVFREPWHAQVFALTVALHEAGHLGWPEWAAYLARAIAEARDASDPDLGDTYYLHWLRALERLVVDKALAQPLALAAMRQAWRLAAETTPHGRPLVLRRAARFASAGDEPA